MAAAQRDADQPDGIGRAVQSAIYRAGVFGRRPAVPVHPDALERAARRAVSANAWQYTNGSAGLERTALANRAALDARQLVPRMLRDVATRDLGIELFGRRLASPLLLSPIGALELLHEQADTAVARAAAAAGVPMVVSTQASVPMESLATELGRALADDRTATPWFYQLYWSNNDDLVASLVSRAEQAGAAGIVVTLDTHLLGWRPRDLDAGYLPFARGLGIAQYTSDPVFSALVERRVAAGSDRTPEPTPRPTPSAVRSLVSMARHYPGSTRDNLRSPLPRAAVETFLDVFSRSDLTWDDLHVLRGRTSLPIILKGLQHPDDARHALDAGVDAVWVSNHGGRQVDGAIGSLAALPGVVEAVDDAVPVLFDSGIRGGADVLKALALGATAVGLGRPYAYGLGIAGQDGVRAVLDHVLAELDLTLGLLGVSSVTDLTTEAIR